MEKKIAFTNRVKACYDKDKSKFVVCMKDLWHELRPVLATGIPEENILPLDPMNIDDFSMEQKSAVIEAKATFSNVTVKGGSKFEIKDIVIDKDKKTVTVLMDIPDLYITGQYDIAGTIMLLPVNGKGPFTLNLTTIACEGVGHMSRKGGLLNMDSLDVKFKIEKMKIAFEGLMDDDTVGQAVRNMIDDNSDAILKDIQPDLEKKSAKIIKSSLGGAFVNLPDAFGI